MNSGRPEARWPVTLRYQYGSITVSEILHFHLIRWRTRRALRRNRMRAARAAAAQAARLRR
jgi:hypothetical protein